MQGLTPQEVRGALWEQRTLVKTWAMRGTLHLFPPAILPLYVAALRTRRHYLNPTWLKYNGMTRADVEALIDGDPHGARWALPDAGATDRCRGRADRVGPPGELLRSGWGMMLKPAAYHGYLCFGPSQGTAVTFVRPDQWLAEWHEMDPAEAMPAVLRAFLTSYGPATRDEFARWWGVQPPEVKGLFQAWPASWRK